MRLSKRLVWKFCVRAIRQDVPHVPHNMADHANGLTTARASWRLVTMR
jgi:hypothetical protein